MSTISSRLRMPNKSCLSQVIHLQAPAPVWTDSVSLPAECQPTTRAGASSFL